MILSTLSIKKLFGVLFISSILFISCNQEDRDKSLNENQGFKKTAPSLLVDGKKYFQSKDYENAKTTLTDLLSNYPDLPEAAEAKNLLYEVNQEDAWSKAMASYDIDITKSYINQYPNGKYITEANKRLPELIAYKEETDYQNAVNANNSNAWREFLQNYPNRKDISDIKRKIISCEVDEIMSDQNTGELPSSQQIGGRGSSVSSVTIENATGCELVVRYSGNDVKMVTIPAAGRSRISLKSGSYRVAASACGYNYAGTKDLSGNYSSQYYIATSYESYRY